jgi:hypothetical protein
MINFPVFMFTFGKISGMDWEPKKHEILKDQSVAQQLHDTGYVVHGNIGRSNIEKLHHFNAPGAVCSTAFIQMIYLTGKMYTGKPAKY